jgi:hypothetical protein
MGQFWWDYSTFDIFGTLSVSSRNWKRQLSTGGGKGKRNSHWLDIWKVAVKVKETHIGLTSGNMSLSNHTEMGRQFSLAVVELKLVMNCNLGFNSIKESADQIRLNNV